jgi:hypothetical protein
VADDVTWGALDGDSFHELRALAHACLEADGGIPLFIGEQMLRGRTLMGESIAARDASGALAAAASVSVGDSGAITTGMMHTPRPGAGDPALAQRRGAPIASFQPPRQPPPQRGLAITSAPRAWAKLRPTTDHARRAQCTLPVNDGHQREVVHAPQPSTPDLGVKGSRVQISPARPNPSTLPT